MPAVYDLKDIARTLGLKSTHAARKRVNSLRKLLERRGLLVYIPEEGGALGVKPEGLELLKRLHEIGKGGRTIGQAAEALLIELGEREEPPSPHKLKAFELNVKRDLEGMRSEIADLAKRVEALEQKRPWWEKLIHMLPRGD